MGPGAPADGPAPARSSGDPGDGVVGVRVVAARGAGVDAVAEVAGQAGVVAIDLRDGGGDGLADGDAGAFGRSAGPSGATAESGGTAEVVEECVAFVGGPVRRVLVPARVGCVER